MNSLFFQHSKPQHYYSHLFFLFTILSLISTFSLIGFRNFQFDVFLVKFVSIFFLFMLISVFVEFFDKSLYISPLEVYNVELFIRNFLFNLERENSIENLKIYFNKYDNKSLNKLQKILLKRNKIFYISSIKKISKNKYKITFIDELVLFRYFFIRFFAKSGIHEIVILKKGMDYKIIYFK